MDKFDTLPFRIESLNLQNYYLWADEVGIFLRWKRLSKYINGGTGRPSKDPSKEQEVYLRKSDMVLAFVMVTIDQWFKASVIRLWGPKIAWVALEKTYQIVSEAPIDA